MTFWKAAHHESLFLRHDLSECQAIAEKVCDSYPESVGEARQSTLSEVHQPDPPLAEEVTLIHESPLSPVSHLTELLSQISALMPD